MNRLKPDNNNMSTRAGKRPMKPLSPQEKLKAIARVHRGESKASVARDIGVPESTLRGWCKNESKIELQSRHSNSPHSDDSQTKRIKLEQDIQQPYNLSMRCDNNGYSSEPATTDSSKSSPPLAQDSRDNINTYPTERSKTRAELARMGAELGLDRPEQFSTKCYGGLNLAQYNMALNNQWSNNLINQKNVQIPKAATIDAIATGTDGLFTTVDHQSQRSKHTAVISWLKDQQQKLNVSQNNIPAHSNISHASSPNTPINLPPSMNMNPYANLTTEQIYLIASCYHSQLARNTLSMVSDKNILYQQLTRETHNRHSSEQSEQNGENVVTSNSPSKTTRNTDRSTKGRSVLDNILISNGNNVESENNSTDQNVIDHAEAIDHGQKFLSWLENYSDPNITLIQVQQFRHLLNSVRDGKNRKNGEVQNINKVKRK